MFERINKIPTNELKIVSMEDTSDTKEVQASLDKKQELIAIATRINRDQKIVQLREENKKDKMTIGEIDNTIVMAIQRNKNNNIEIYELPLMYYENDLVIEHIYYWVSHLFLNENLEEYESKEIKV